MLIYGVAEPQDKPKRYIPDRLDPVLRTEISKEWLGQLIHSIQPRIDAVVIHPVTIDERKREVCYVVEIPQSHTAHQARDHVYCKRHNFSAEPMEDYEVRDVMNRKPVLVYALRFSSINALAGISLKVSFWSNWRMLAGCSNWNCRWTCDITKIRLRPDT